MKKITLALMLVMAFSCTKKDQNTEPNYALISGTITNSDITVAVLSGPDFELKMDIDQNTRTFNDTLYLPKAGFYQFASGEVSTLYLKNGYDLNISIDAEKFDESITYSGLGSAENNYLAAKFMDNETLQGSLAELYALNEADFVAKVEGIKSIHLQKLEAAKIPDAKFTSNERENLKYESYSLYNNYENIHKSLTKNPDFEVSEGFIPKELVNLSFDDAKLYSISLGYKDLAMKRTLDNLFSEMEDFQAASPQDLLAIDTIEIPELKNEIIANYGVIFLSPGNPNMVENYKFLKRSTSSEKTKKALTVAYERGLKLKPGEPSPEFVNYENHKGGETSLADLRGHYVYIDVWATWCGPCLREIPSLKDIETKYHNSNIAFVSTSIDRAKDHDKWVEMVKNKQLGGIQLMADNDWQSKFVEDYGIDGIPRFILIDPDGKIVNADAPRPSNPKLVELFEELKL